MIGSSITALIVLLRVFARIFVARASKELTSVTTMLSKMNTKTMPTAT